MERRPLLAKGGNAAFGRFTAEAATSEAPFGSELLLPGTPEPERSSESLTTLLSPPTSVGRLKLASDLARRCTADVGDPVCLFWFYVWEAFPSP